MKVEQAQFELWLEDFKTLTDNNEYSLTMPPEVANGHSIVLTLDDDLMLTISDYDILQDTQFEVGASKQSGVFIVLDGEMDMTIDEHIQASISQSSVGIFFADAEKYQFNYSKGRLRMINFTASTELMLSLAQQYKLLKIHQQKSQLWLMPVNGEILSIIEQISECKLPRQSKLIYVKAKLMELLSLLFEWRHTQQEIEYSGSANTISLMTKAAQIMEQEMAAPPTLIELAKRVGVNDNKLKKAFKQVFKQTVFEYLHQQRMNKAKELLSEPGASVKAVAHQVGFKHQGHFSAKFQDRFSVTPSELLKKLPN